MRRGVSKVTIISLIVLIVAMAIVTIIFGFGPIFRELGEKAISVIVPSTAVANCSDFQMIITSCTTRSSGSIVALRYDQGKEISKLNFEFNNGRSAEVTNEIIGVGNSKTYEIEAGANATSINVKPYFADGSQCSAISSACTLAEQPIPGCSFSDPSWKLNGQDVSNVAPGKVVSLDIDKNSECNGTVYFDIYLNGTIPLLLTTLNTTGDSATINLTYQGNYYFIARLGDIQETSDLIIVTAEIIGQCSSFSCNDGCDNDGDSWTDQEDLDCKHGNSEYLIAVNECGDGIDNDLDGKIDKADSGCSSSSSLSEKVTNLASAGPHNFAFVFGNSTGGQFFYERTTTFLELNWTHNGVTRRVIWDELADNRYFPSGTRSFFHSTPSSNGGSAWGYKVGGSAISVKDSEISYSVPEVSQNSISLKVNDSRLEINDLVQFSGDTMYLTVKVKNVGSEDLKNIALPVDLRGIQIGNYDRNYHLTNPNGLWRIGPTRAGFLQDVPDNRPEAIVYPGNAFSPATSYGDDSIALGVQLLSPIYQPDSISLWTLATSSFTPAVLGGLNFSLYANEERTFVFAFVFSDSDNWESSLQPYKNWFDSQYNSKPRYCPGGLFFWAVGWNAGPSAFSGGSPPYQYLPGTTLDYLFNGQNGPSSTQQFGINYVGLWTLGLHSYNLIEPGNGPGQLESCRDSGGGYYGCEFSGNIDIIDPNLDAGPNQTKLTVFADKYHSKNTGVFVYARPCGNVYGASITYGQNGQYTIKKGRMSGYSDIDLRNISNRDEQFKKIDFYAKLGIDGFYFDAIGCPGETAFFNYARNKLKQKYGKEFFLLNEGSFDRNAIMLPQLPIIKFSDASGYVNEHSLLANLIVPDATYYGGRFNNMLDDREIEDILDKGYTAIPINWIYSPGGSGVTTEQARNICGWIDRSYENRYQKWQDYGSSIGCAAPPQNPPRCPL